MEIRAWARCARKRGYAGRRMASDAMAIRAGLMQDMVACLRTWPGDGGERVLATVGSHAVGQIESVLRLAWLPGQLNVDFVAAIAETFGREDGCSFFAELYAKTWDSRLFRSMVTAGIRLAGSDPGFLLKLIPRGSPFIFRGFGTWKFHSREPDQVRLDYVDIPDILFANGGAWLHFAAASQRSIISLAGRTGSIEVESSALSERRARFLYRWQ